MSRFSLALLVMICASFTGGMVRSAAAEDAGANYIFVWNNGDGTYRCNPISCWPWCGTGKCACCP